RWTGDGLRRPPIEAPPKGDEEGGKERGEKGGDEGGWEKSTAARGKSRNQIDGGARWVCSSWERGPLGRETEIEGNPYNGSSPRKEGEPRDGPPQDQGEQVFGPRPPGDGDIHRL